MLSSASITQPHIRSGCIQRTTHQMCVVLYFLHYYVETRIIISAELSLGLSNTDIRLSDAVGEKESMLPILYSEY